MSETTAAPAADASEATAANPDQSTPETTEAPEKVTETLEHWKAMARKNEQRAKANADAAKRLAEIEEASKTAEQKAADREKAALERAQQAEARALRSEIAIEFSLSKDDAELLDGLADEDAMRRIAARLQAADKVSKTRNVVPKEGTNPRPKADSERQFVKQLFGAS